MLVDRRLSGSCQFGSAGPGYVGSRQYGSVRLWHSGLGNSGSVRPRRSPQEAQYIVRVTRLHSPQSVEGMLAIWGGSGADCR
jgi:hypothetical protein